MAESPRRDEPYPLVGEIIGAFRLVRGIGRGGMGEVYEAEYDFAQLFALHVPDSGEAGRAALRRELARASREDQARVASRLLGINLPADARFALKLCNARHGTPGYNRFLQEARLAQRLGDHPHILTVHAINGDDGPQGALQGLALDRGRYRDLAFMVMDLAESRIDKDNLTIGETVHLIRCIALALDHAHSQNVIHRDLKPENILGSVDQPYLTDFGIAKDADLTDGLTRTGQIIGTLDYMSPEQATDAKAVDARSDIYSLGVVLYEFATQGGLPYAHKNDRESVLNAIRSERYEPKWPREHRPGFPVSLERIILKAMAFRREDRYQTMAQFIADLDEFTALPPNRTLGWYGRVPVRSQIRAQLRFHPRIVWGCVTALLILILAAAIIYIPRWIDSTRRGYEKDLARLEPQLLEMQLGQRQQLDKEHTRSLQELRARLGQERNYGELRDRLAQVESQLLQLRSLRVAFTQDSANAQQAMTELEIATNSAAPAWHLDKAAGLMVSEYSQASLGPYGQGTLFVNLVITLPQTGWSGILLETAEQQDPRHLVQWFVSVPPLGVVGGGATTVQCGLREDEKPVTLLRQERLPGLRVPIALELTEDGIRTWIGRQEQRLNRQGLRLGAPAVLRLTLPKDSVVEYLEISPRRAR